MFGALGYFLILYCHALTNRFALLPTLLVKRRPFAYVGATVILILVFTFLIHQYSMAWLQADPHPNPAYNRDFLYQAAGVTANLVIILGPVIMLKFYREQQRQQEEALLFNELQLQSLRSQLNPHFLFNTFNTLYGTSLAHPERTPDLIMKVSQLLRYQIDSDSRQWVTLEDELEFIESYIQLEKERVGYRCHIVFDNKIANPDAYKMPPMLLIVFVENAFKHGTGTVESCFVNITLERQDGKLLAGIRNSIPQKKPSVVSTKIGLKKTRERLELLYGQDYRLDIQQNAEDYSVTLEIPLKKVASCHPCAVA